MEEETTFCTHKGYNTVAPCGKDCPTNQPIEEKWNENVETCSDCGIQWKKIGKSCQVCFAPAEPKHEEPIEEKWKETFVEAGANIEHDRWARWQKYLHSRGIVDNQGEGYLCIPMGLIKRWERQIDTPYSELSEAEKESDRKESRNYLPIIENLLEQERQRMSDEIEKLKQYNSHIGIGGLHSADMQIVHNDAIDKALSIINK